LDSCGKKGGEAWVIKVAVAGSAEGRERCTKRLAPSAKRSARYLSNPAKTVRCIAEIALQNVKTKDVKRYTGSIKSALFLKKRALFILSLWNFLQSPGV
jgi:hypothetical protein